MSAILARCFSPTPPTGVPVDNYSKSSTPRKKTISYSNILPATSDNVEAAVSSLKNGNVVALPTDTLYGLAGSAKVSSAVQKLYTIKGRPDAKPLAICVGDPQDVGRFGDVSALPEGLVGALLPGPVTIILRRLSTEGLSQRLNPDVLSIGIRVPSSDFIRDVARGLEGALALTSANPTGATSTTQTSEFSELWNQERRRRGFQFGEFGFKLF